MASQMLHKETFSKNNDVKTLEALYKTLLAFGLSSDVSIGDDISNKLSITKNKDKYVVSFREKKEPYIYGIYDDAKSASVRLLEIQCKGIKKVFAEKYFLQLIK